MFSNILASFENYINVIIVKKLNIIILIHFDDIFVYIKDQNKEQTNAI